MFRQIKNYNTGRLLAEAQEVASTWRVFNPGDICGKDGQSCCFYLKWVMFMFDVKVKTSSHKNKPSNEKTDQSKGFKHRKDITYLFYCIVIMYGMWEGWTKPCGKCICFCSGKENSCLGHVSVLLPGRPWQRFFQPIHWVLKWWETTCIFNH